MMNRFLTFFCACLIATGNYSLAQDKDKKPLVAKPVAENKGDGDEKSKKKDDSKKEKAENKKSDKPEEKSDEEMAEKSDDKKSDDKKSKADKKEDSGEKKEGMARLSELFVKAWEPGVKLSSDEHSEFMKLLPQMLPGKDFLGDDLEWRLLVRDAEDTGNDMVTVNLSKKGSDPYAREMFFQLDYNTTFAEGASNEAFEGYHSFALPGVHQMVLIGHIEIRAVATADRYKAKDRIEEVLRAFPLKEIEKL